MQQCSLCDGTMCQTDVYFACFASTPLAALSCVYVLPELMSRYPDDAMGWFVSALIRHGCAHAWHEANLSRYAANLSTDAANLSREGANLSRAAANLSWDAANLSWDAANAADGSWQDSTVHKHFGIPAAAL